MTEPRDLPRLGVAHPTSLVLDEVLSALTGLGFDVVEGPEIELDHYNFELLNLPKNHPARDAQDTFYVDDNIVLRTHTSPVQARTMLTRKPPHPHRLPRPRVPRRRGGRYPQPRVPSDRGPGDR